MQLRDYQVKAIDALRTEAKAGHKRILLVMPTGAGKTVCAAELIRSANGKGRNVLFVAHRREILEQTSRKLDAIDIPHAWIMAGKEKSASAQIQLASIQTLIRRDHPLADIVIWDEAHHGRAKSYQDVFAKYPEAFHLGLTATPCRGDGKGLGNIFDRLIQPVTYEELLIQKHLVPVIAYAPNKPDLEGVHVRGGDYVEGELAEKMDKPKLVGDIVSHWERLAHDRLTLVFAVTIAHALHIQEAFRAAGHDFEELDGEAEPEIRADILAKLQKGKIQGIVNVGLFTEGTDIPEVSCLILARPTKSFGFYRQIAGRGLRPASNKENLLLIDHSGSIYTHGLPTEDVIWDLDSDTIAHKKTEKSETKKACDWTCGYCGFVNSATRSPYCGACKQKMQKLPKGIKIKDGELIPIDPKKKAQSKLDKQKFWNECLWIAYHKDMKVGAAAHMYKNKMGVWPIKLERIPKGGQWKMTAREFVELTKPQEPEKRPGTGSKPTSQPLQNSLSLSGPLSEKPF